MIGTSAVKEDLGAAVVVNGARGIEPEALECGGHEVGDCIIAAAAHRHEGLARARHPSRVHPYLAAAGLRLSV